MKGEDALLVRCQNISNPNDPYSVTQSKLALTLVFQLLFQYISSFLKWHHNFTRKLIGHWNPANIRFHKITEHSVVFEPSNEWENYGTEDPRIVYDHKSKLYYLLYSAVQQYPNGNVISRFWTWKQKTFTILFFCCILFVVFFFDLSLNLDISDISLVLWLSLDWLWLPPQHHKSNLPGSVTVLFFL